MIGPQEVKVEELWTYPVKSCQGIALDTTRFTATGLEHDREFMLVGADGRFLTQRTEPALARIAVGIDKDVLTLAVDGYGTYEHALDRTDMDDQLVETAVHKTPCHGVDQGDEVGRFFTGFLGQSVRLLKIDRATPRLVRPDFKQEEGTDQVSFADSLPILLTSRASLYELHRRTGLPHGTVPMNRFRPNIVVDGPIDAFEEDEWKRLRSNSVCLFVAKACGRCVMTGIEQVGAAAGEQGNVAVLRDFLASRNGYDMAVPAHPRGRFFGQNVLHRLDAIGLPIRVGQMFTIVERGAPNVQLS